MKCDDVEKQIDSLFDNEFDSVIRSAIERHLKECATCGQNYAKLQAVNSLLVNAVPVPDPKRLDARVRQAFRQRHNKKHETKERLDWWASLSAGLNATPKTAFAAVVLLFAVSIGLAFQLGRITAATIQTASPQSDNVEQAAASNEKNEPVSSADSSPDRNAAAVPVTKFIKVPVIKEIKVPVIKEKVVNRFVYVAGAQGRKPVKNNTSMTFRGGAGALKNSMQKNEFLTETDLKGFQLVSDSKARIIKKGESDEN